MRCRSLAALTAAVGLVAVIAPPADAQEPALATVLARAGAYVLEFQRRLSGIVAQERYVQDVVFMTAATGTSDSKTAAVRHRELTSDLLLIRPIGADRWIQFRDVFDVDGKPVRDRSERLAKVFLAPTSSSAEQAQMIVGESTRYNIGNLDRTVNVPVLPLAFLDPKQQRRFRFTRTSNAGPALGVARVAGAAWTIEYQEVEKDTAIRTTNGRDLPSRGRFWVEPGTGRVLMTELVAADAAVRAVIVVRYTEDGTIGLLVPGEMREVYDVRYNRSRVEGTATYSNFRQFTVTVDEKLAPLVKP
jgi:hypothetical protein